MKPQLRRLVRRLTADKKKFSVMLLLVLVGLLLWGRLLLKQVPRSAIANPSGQVASAPPDNDDGSSMMFRTVYVDLPEKLSRDLFALDRRFYDKSGPDGTVVQIDEKPPSQHVDTQQGSDPINVTEALRELNLQFTLGGDRPRAMINNEMLVPGDTIKGFELIKILNRKVILRINGIDVPLGM